MTAIPLRRKLLYAAVTFVVAAVTSVVAVLALDIYLHHRVQYVGGVNVWGYRGPVVSRKKPAETRILAIGGSTVFGYGLPWNESWPYFLDRRLNGARDQVSGRTPVTVVNLGVPSDSARTFVATMEDYAYLKGDLIVFYEGYNDLGLDVDEPDKSVVDPETIPAGPVGGRRHYLAWRHQSRVFQWTGYFPIFPLVLNEKAMALLHGGDLNAAYKSRGTVVFRPGLATRATAETMKVAAEIGASLERRFGQLTAEGSGLSTASDDSCGRWSQYCGAMDEAVRHALAHGQRVLIVTQPYLSDLHVDQQRALAANLQSRFGSDKRARYLNLGRSVDLRDRNIAYDGMHLTAVGNKAVADALAPAVAEMIATR